MPIKFEDLEFEIHPMFKSLSTSALVAKKLSKDLNLGYRAVVDLPNGYKISVITGAMFYSTQDEPYEAMVIAVPNKERKKDKEPQGYLTQKELINYINKIARRRT